MCVLLQPGQHGLAIVIIRSDHLVCACVCLQLLQPGQHGLRQGEPLPVLAGGEGPDGTRVLLLPGNSGGVFACVWSLCLFFLGNVCLFLGMSVCSRECLFSGLSLFLGMSIFSRECLSVCSRECLSVFLGNDCLLSGMFVCLILGVSVSSRECLSVCYRECLSV